MLRDAQMQMEMDMGHGAWAMGHGPWRWTWMDMDGHGHGRWMGDEPVNNGTHSDGSSWSQSVTTEPSQSRPESGKRAQVRGLRPEKSGQREGPGLELSVPGS